MPYLTFIDCSCCALENKVDASTSGDLKCRYCQTPLVIPANQSWTHFSGIHPRHKHQPPPDTDIPESERKNIKIN